MRVCIVKLNSTGTPNNVEHDCNPAFLYVAYTLRKRKKKGTKAVTGAVPFQKVHFCT